jgi:hypothetical protein
MALQGSNDLVREGSRNNITPGKCNSSYGDFSLGGRNLQVNGRPDFQRPEGNVDYLCNHLTEKAPAADASRKVQS